MPDARRRRDRARAGDTGGMDPQSEPAPREPAPRHPALPEPALPDWLGERLAGFERHLAAERGLSPHTVRAYVGDVGALLEHASQDGLSDLAALDIGLIRSWLACSSRAPTSPT